MKKVVSILAVLSLVLSFSIASIAEDTKATEESVDLISEAPVEEIEADSAADEIEADSAADEIKADSAADEIEADSAADEIEADSAADEIEADSAATAVFYTDLSDDDWAFSAIVELTKKGVISGGEDKTVRPDDGVTRQEVAKIILGARGYEVNEELSLEVADADNVADWAKGYVATAVDKGIIKGYEDGTVKPENVVTRAEFAALIVRALSATSEVQGESFTDVSADAWYAADVECAKNLGIVGGYEDGTFRGDNTVTRREAFAMVYRMVNLLDALQQG